MQKRSPSRPTEILTETIDTCTPPPGDSFETAASLRVVGGPLHVGGRSPEYWLTLPVGASIVIGRDESCDFVLTDRSVSRWHAIVKRTGESEFTITKHPKGRTEPRFSSLARGAKTAGFGARFSLGNTRLMIYNVAMRGSRRTAAWWLGTGADCAGKVDSLLAYVTVGDPVLWLAEVSLWTVDLARFLHEKVSSRSAGPFVAITTAPTSESDRDALIATCAGGSAYLRVPEVPGATKPALMALVTGLLESGVATYVAASNVEIARAGLGDELQALFRTIKLAPLTDRPDEIESLVAGYLRWRKHPYTVDQFAPNMPALRAMTMENNFYDLGFAIEAMIAIATLGPDKAARFMGKKRGTFYDWRTKFGVVELDLVEVDTSNESLDDVPLYECKMTWDTVDSEDEP
jgi:hypothetical protein